MAIEWIAVQQDIIEYLFLLDGLAGGVQRDLSTPVSASAVEAPGDATNARWWRRAANEAISRLRGSGSCSFMWDD